MRSFRRCLSQFGTGVTVITAQLEGERVGVTANSFSSLSLDPPLIVWALNRRATSLALFESASHFAVNILAADQIDVSRCFSTPGIDRFGQVPWCRGETGAPILADVLAVLECEREAMHDGGDHVLMVGRVRKFTRFEKEPLLFVQGRYGVAVDHPGLKAPPTAATQAPVAETSLLVMLLFAYQALSEKFDAHRQAEGLTLAQSRVLAVLHRNPDGLTLASLVRQAYLGMRDAEDAVAELAERSLVQRCGGELLRLTDQGRERREALLRRLHEFDAQQLAGLPDTDIESIRGLLTHVIEGPAAPRQSA
ncbi:flavin reductase family protein [Aquincola sp. S2]|uniref:Flavin reductase family protein n=2 Tax=Pseudaquabacterium terrae TaxID=2732868 RepID=A0ABX2EV07_9BURK|nr:flavin reductase family protein [Aquabacterium terrae]